MLKNNGFHNRHSPVLRFSPLSLFAGGAPGAWYDPSDLTTLFQDSAGTTPVTAVEQPVGLMLDKSQGLVLGSELVTNGAFDSDTGWTKGAGWTIGGGAASIDGTNTAASLLSQTTVTVTAGRSYAVQLTYTVSAGLIRFNTAQFGQTSPSLGVGSGTIRYILTATSSTGTFSVQATVANTIASIDNISVKELPGNHAFQATSASRPVLSARYNLLTKTEQFDDAVWVKAATVAVSSNFDGNADRVTYNGSGTGGDSAFIQQLAASPGGTASRSFTVSATIKSAGAGNQTIRLKNTHSAVLDNFSSDITVTPTYQTFTFTVTNGASAGNGIQTAGLVAGTANAAYDIVVASFSIVPANQSTLPYQRVNTATDYATTGFLPYLKFDGVDDSLSTNSISFTATDKMSVFAGVRKLSEVGAIIAELSVASATNNGSFTIFNSPSNTPGYGWQSSGTIRATAEATSGYVVPITNTLTGLGDISGDRATLRINGTQVAQSTADQGTGNYGTYPLYIGRRNNASLPFNGQMYSMVIVGKAVTAGELSSTETYVNQKTGAY